ncbi:MAG: phage portal protein, partial [Burkholderiales bacterium]
MFDKLRELAVQWAAQKLSVQNSGRYKLSDRQAMSEIFQMPGTAGPLVNAATSMQVSAVYACVSLIAGAIASLPLAFYKRAADGGRESIKHDLWWLFNEQPSPLIPAAVFWEYIITAILLQGDGFAMLVRDRNGVIKEIIPLSPLDVQVMRDGSTLTYAVNDQHLGTFGVHQDDMLHFFGFGFNGLRCMSVIKHAAAQAIGTALSTDQYATSFFHNGAHPSHVITYPNPVTAEQIDALRSRWAQRTAGLSNAHMPLVLTSGATVKELSLNAEDAQLMEVRKFTVIDICRAFGVP